MTRRSITAVIFDLDGTLIKSNIDFLKMKNRIIAYFGSLGVHSEYFSSSSPTFEIVEKGIGLLEKTASAEIVSITRRIINQIMTDVEMEQAGSVSAVTGASETMKWLKERGIYVGVLTRSCRGYALKSLETVGLLELVDFVSARDDVDRPKPDPGQLIMLADRMNVNLKETLMVGDHPIDALCAKSSNVRFIGVLTGSSETDAFKKIGCEFIGSVKDLPRFLLQSV